MNRRVGHVGTLALVAAILAACEPVPTVVDEAPSFVFRETAGHDLALIANRPLDFGDVEVAGLNLEIDSEYCDPCVAGPDNYVRLTFPQEADANYSERIEITVTSGVLIKGKAWFTLAGEDVTRPATLQVRP